MFRALAYAFLDQVNFKELPYLGEAFSIAFEMGWAQRRLATINYARAQRDDVITGIDQDVRDHLEVIIQVARTPWKSSKFRGIVTPGK